MNWFSSSLVQHSCVTISVFSENSAVRTNEDWKSKFRKVQTSSHWKSLFCITAAPYSSEQLAPAVRGEPHAERAQESPQFCEHLARNAERATAARSFTILSLSSMISVSGSCWPKTHSDHGSSAQQKCKQSHRSDLGGARFLDYLCTACSHRIEIVSFPDHRSAVWEQDYNMWSRALDIIG